MVDMTKMARHFIAVFFASGLLGFTLDLTRQMELLFQIETAIVRGLIAFWVVEIGSRLARSVIDAACADRPTLYELYDRLPSTLTSGIALYCLLAAWVGGGAVIAGMFQTDPYSALGSFLKYATSITASLWLLLNILTFISGSRQQAHEFLSAAKRLGLRLEEGRVKDAPEPIDDYN